MITAAMVLAVMKKWHLEHPTWAPKVFYSEADGIIAQYRQDLVDQWQKRLGR